MEKTTFAAKAFFTLLSGERELISLKTFHPNNSTEMLFFAEALQSSDEEPEPFAQTVRGCPACHPVRTKSVAQSITWSRLGQEGGRVYLFKRFGSGESGDLLFLLLFRTGSPHWFASRSRRPHFLLGPQ